MKPIPIPPNYRGEDEDAIDTLTPLVTLGLIVAVGVCLMLVNAVCQKEAKPEAVKTESQPAHEKNLERTNDRTYEEGVNDALKQRFVYRALRLDEHESENGIDFQVCQDLKVRFWTNWPSKP